MNNNTQHTSLSVVIDKEAYVVSSVLAVEHALCTTSYSAVSDDDMHKLPASRDERADGGHGSESLRYTQCARPSAVRVTRGARVFTLSSFRIL